MKVAKFKTSITVPHGLVRHWQKLSAGIFGNLGGYLARYQRGKTRRDRLRQYTERGSECVICNVYWEMEVYNQLHAVAGRLRVSVSHLLLEILLFVMQGGKSERLFTSYAFIYSILRDGTATFTEKLICSRRRKRKTEKIT